MDENIMNAMKDLFAYGQSVTVGGKHISMKDIRLHLCSNTYELTQRLREEVSRIIQEKHNG